MPGPGNQWLGGPLQTGTQANQSDFGTAILVQSATMTQNGSTAVSVTMTIPQASKIIDLIADTTVVWNSGTSDTLSVGTAAAGTQYASGVDTKTSAGRVRPTFTATQLTNMSNTTTNTSVVWTVTPVGTAATTGTTIVTMIYEQTVQLTTGIT